MGASTKLSKAEMPEWHMRNAVVVYEHNWLKVCGT